MTVLATLSVGGHPSEASRILVEPDQYVDVEM